MRHYSNIFLRHIWLLAVPLLLAPLLLAVLIKPVPDYTVRATLWVEQTTLTDPNLFAKSDEVETAAEGQSRLLLDSLVSRTYLDKLVDQLEQAGFPLTKKRREDLQLRLAFSFKAVPVGQHSLRLEFSDTDWQLLLWIVRQICNDQLEQANARFKRDGLAQIAFIENQLKQAQTDLERADHEVATYLGVAPTANRPATGQEIPGGLELEYQLRLQNQTNSRDRYQQLKASLENTRISYGAFISGQASIIEIRDQPFLASSFTFNPLGKSLLGVGFGLYIGLMLAIIGGLVLVWSDRTLGMTTAFPRTRLGVNLTLALPELRGVAKSRRPRQWLKIFKVTIIGGLLLGGTVGAVLMAVSQPGLVALLLTVAVGVLLVCRWPVVGLWLLVLMVLVCEVFPIDDGISTFTSMPLTNLNSLTQLPLSATAQDILVVLTIIASLVHVGLKRGKWFDLSIMSGLVGALGLFLVYGYIWGVYIQHGVAKTAQWEIRALFYVVFIYFLTVHHMGQRKYWPVLSWLMITGLMLLGGLTVYRFFTLPDPGESLSGFNHETAILLVLLVMWGVVKWLYGGTFYEKMVATLAVPLGLFGVAVSGRRAPFLCLAVGLLMVLAVMFWRYRRAAIVCTIILALLAPPYVLLFSKVEGPLGAAARAFSSTSAQPGTRDYNSDLYRIVEKNNVQLTIKQSPLTGIGFGRAFTRYIYFINLDGFVFQDYTPHIQVLWLWLKLGVFGWLTFWLIICLALFKLGQIVRYQSDKLQLSLAVMVGVVIASIMVYSYLDLGLINLRLTSLLGLAVGMLEAAYRLLPSRTAKSAASKAKEEAVKNIAPVPNSAEVVPVGVR